MDSIRAERVMKGIMVDAENVLAGPVQVLMRTCEGWRLQGGHRRLATPVCVSLGWVPGPRELSTQYSNEREGRRGF